MPSQLDREYDELNRRLAGPERKARSSGVARVEKRIPGAPRRRGAGARGAPADDVPA